MPKPRSPFQQFLRDPVWMMLAGTYAALLLMRYVGWIGQAGGP